MNDAEFLAALENCTLPPALFSHEGHVRAAYLCLNELDFPQALAKMSAAIRAYASHLGSPGKYHVTITVACMSLIAQQMAERGSAESWQAFKLCNPELFAPDLLGRYYDASQLQSETARRTFVLPRPAKIPRC